MADSKTRVLGPPKLWGTLFGVVGPIGNNCGAKSQDQAQTIVEDGTIVRYYVHLYTRWGRSSPSILLKRKTFEDEREKKCSFAQIMRLNLHPDPFFTREVTLAIGENA